MAGFTKLFNTIITSSVWSEDDKTRILWITMLASADAKGFVDGTIPGMAALARISVDDAAKGIRKLESPDAYSRTADNDGRRIEAVEGGWLILNYARYRERRDPEKRREQNRQAKRRQREREKSAQCQPCQPNVSLSRSQSYSFCPNSTEFRLAKLLFDLIRERKPDFKEPNLQTWAVQIDRMIRLDKRKPERIESVIRWAQQDPFWENNILSTDKLRKQFDRLELKMAANRRSNSEPETAPAPVERLPGGKTARDLALEGTRV